jgi:hypothetical protein
MGSVKDIISYLPVVITTVMVVITAVTNILNRRDRPRKILKWPRPIFARTQSVDQLSVLPRADSV